MNDPLEGALADRYRIEREAGAGALRNDPRFRRPVEQVGLEAALDRGVTANTLPAARPPSHFCCRAPSGCHG